MKRTMPWITLVGLLIAGCSSIREPIAGPDVPAPPGYAPVFITRTAPYQTAVHAPFVMISRAQMKTSQAVRLMAHVLDSSGVLYTGIGSKAWQKLICEVTTEINGRTVPLQYRLTEYTAATAEQAAFVLVLDHSGSMGQQRALALQDAAHAVIAQKRPNDELAIVKFDDHIEVESALSASQTELKGRLRRVGLHGFGGFTAIADGAYTALNLLTTSRAPNKAVIIVTDGYDNKSRVHLDSLIARARTANIPICTVGFGYGIDEDYLRGIATATGGMYQRIYRTDEFRLVLPSIYTLFEHFLALDVMLEHYGLHRIRIKLCPPAPATPSTAEIMLDNTPDIGTIGVLAVYFDHDRAELKPESKPALDNIESLMRAYPVMVIQLRGHTDSTGSTEYNLRLSERRAAAVRAELIRRGIEDSRITAIGLGSSQPIADNRTPEGRAQNRRTEFVILQK